MRFEKNKELSKITRLGVGGKADNFIRVESTDALKQALKSAAEKNLPVEIIGEGTNLLVADNGVRGLVIQIAIKNLEWSNPNHLLTLGAGENFSEAIKTAVEKGWGGMENMYGIPGNVGGAVYGNVGAYGTEIKDVLLSVTILKGESIIELTNHDCEFSYRSSIFKKHKDWIILGATVRLSPAEPKVLKKQIDEVYQTRLVKYPEGLKCPGSFFKNIQVDNLNLNQMAAIKQFSEKIKGGKLAAGILLEAIGAKGQEQGDAAVADYHGNLIYNKGHATFGEVVKLSKFLKLEVFSKFGIELDEEVQFLGEF